MMSMVGVYRYLNIGNLCGTRSSFEQLLARGMLKAS